ncbi:aminoacyl-tRNA deacylase [Oenococcus alcoholitolerans]|uniref:aminoacyl-tRNA deacylase n=1 Tax=Oenococcus alcoholitolerans TaxID=931074 RepID=UPI003F726660
MSKKNKVKKTQVEQILEKNNIQFRPVELDMINSSEEEKKAALDKLKIGSESLIYKTLASKGDKTGPLIAVIPITSHLDEKKLAAVSGNKRTEMLPLKELQKTTGYIHGANNPVGIWHRSHGKFPIFFDKQAIKDGRIYVSAGELGRSDGIDAKQVADFIKAEFADLTA